MPDVANGLDVFIPLTADAGGGNDGQSGSPLSTLVRLANFDPAEVVDFCYKLEGSTEFTGPEISPGTVGGSPPDGGLGFDAGGFDAFPESDDGGLWDGVSDTTPVDAPLPDATFDAEFDAGDAAFVTDGGSSGEAGRQGMSVGVLPFAASGYVKLNGSGTFTLRIVAAGDSCEHPIYEHEVTLDPGNSTTLVFTIQVPPAPSGTDGGRASQPGPRLLSFIDEPGYSAGAARTRFINVSASAPYAAGTGALSVGVLDSRANFTPLASVVDPESASSPSSMPPVIDALGYHEGPALDDPLAFRIGASASAGGPLSWTSAARSLGIKARSVQTGFIVGEGPGDYLVVWCDDLHALDGPTICTPVTEY